MAKTTATNDSYYYLASYPKSGNTWCRTFIADLTRENKSENHQDLDVNRDLETGAICSSRHWFDDQVCVNSADLNFREIDQIRGDIGESEIIFQQGMRYHKVHDSFITPYSKNKPIVQTKGCAGAIYIIRNPQDVAISLSHHNSCSIEIAVKSILNSDAGCVANPGVGKKQLRQFLGNWGYHVRSWTNQSLIKVLTIRYEDMLNTSEKTFTSIADFLNINKTSDEIKQSIANTSFDKLKEIENTMDGPFLEKPKGLDNFFRSGKTGEGKKYLNQDQIDKINKAFENEMKIFSYS